MFLHLKQRKGETTETKQIYPGIVNRTKSNSIRGLSSIEYGNWTKSNTRLSVSLISEQIEFNPSDWVRLGSETELNRTQLNGLRSTGSGKPVQRKPKASPSKQVFLCVFTIYSYNRNPIHKLSMAFKRTERILFCSHLNFRATRIFTRATHSSSFARERLLRRLSKQHFW